MLDIYFKLKVSLSPSQLPSFDCEVGEVWRALRHHSFCHGEVWRAHRCKKNDIFLAKLTNSEFSEANRTLPLLTSSLPMMHRQNNIAMATK